MAVAVKTKDHEQLSLDNLLAELETFDAFKFRLKAECSRYSQSPGVNLIANKISRHLKNLGASLWSSARPLKGIRLPRYAGVPCFSSSMYVRAP